jgi:hypothetical protein
MAVDTEHHMIVALEVTNEGHDRNQLAPMANLARDAMGQKKVTVLADRGYFKSEQILECDQTGITQGLANPIGTFWSVVMLLEHLGEPDAAKRVMSAIEQVTANPTLHTRDLGGKATTVQVTQAVCELLTARSQRNAV